MYPGSVRPAPCWEVATSPGRQRTDLYLPEVPTEVPPATKTSTTSLPEMKGTEGRGDRPCRKGPLPPPARSRKRLKASASPTAPSKAG